MCGISGFVSASPAASGFEPRRRLAAMIRTLRHRGPDDEGIWNDDYCGLAHARLSIIDLSQAGHQPMPSADGRLWISYNGEVYNFQGLRRELEAKGYVFRSRSDTETILYAYDAWGDESFSRLRGMFALAIWDRAKRQLVLARDRIGKKPLYYATLGDRIVFGSEIKAILSWPEVDRGIDLVAIDQYLGLGYALSPRTAFAAVRKLPPAHYMVVRLSETGGMHVDAPVRYWRLPPPGRRKSGTNLAELQVELLERLKEAIKLRLVADVPLGAFLSGGVDSSAIVALMSQAGVGRVKTFSIGFAHPEYDETSYARRVAQRYGTEHEEAILEPDVASTIPRLVWHFGEPFADSSMMPTFFLAELTRRKVKVALSGDGGDEDFLGYGRYETCRKLQRLDFLPLGLRRAAGFLLRHLPGFASARHRGQLQHYAELLAGAEQKPSQRYAFTIGLFLDYHKREGYAEPMRRFLAGSVYDVLDSYFVDAPSLLAGANQADIHTYLPEDLMVKVDVATMAHGLESRSPLLDHELMEWAAQLPEEVKMAGGVTKSLFKKALEPYLDRDLLYRRKMGFGCPIDHWLRGPLRELAYDTLLSPSAQARGIFRRDYVERLLEEHVSGLNAHHPRIWALLMLELWFQAWVDRPANDADCLAAHLEGQ
jgi:asparagine synthase (glutamine-hydrolysing)